MTSGKIVIIPPESIFLANKYNQPQTKPLCLWLSYDEEIYYIYGTKGAGGNFFPLNVLFFI